MTTVVLEGKEYQLDIKQAKQLGLLKEKDSRVKSWEEYIKKYVGIHGYSYNMNMNMITHSETPIYTADQLTKHEAKALAAFSRLLKLRRDWIGEWEPDWTPNNRKGSIYCKLDCVDCDWCTQLRHALSFPTLKMAKDFLETFRDLIEEAKILI